VIESYASGRAFGRVDLRINAEGRVVASTIRAPQDLCALGEDGNPVPASACAPGDYEGKPVVPDPAVAAIAERAVAQAAELREQPLGVTLTAAFPKSYAEESPEGNLFVDLMREARPAADVAMTNGGGLRADLPAGPLTYGGLYEAMPFDNRFAMVTLNGVHLRRLVTNNLFTGSGIFSWSGITVDAACGKDGEMVVKILDGRGKPIADDRTLTLVTSDFLASGGDGAIGRLGLPEGSVQLEEVIIRDAVADLLRSKPAGTELSPEAFFSPKKPRMKYPGKRPVKCRK
jgi:5'-nucleotidase